MCVFEQSVSHQLVWQRNNTNIIIIAKETQIFVTIQKSLVNSMLGYPSEQEVYKPPMLPRKSYHVHVT